MEAVYIESQPQGIPLGEDEKQVLWLDKDIIAKGWDIGTIETIFTTGLVNTGETIVDFDKISDLFKSLEHSKKNLDEYRLSLKKFYRWENKQPNRERRINK